MEHDHLREREARAVHDRERIASDTAVEATHEPREHRAEALGSRTHEIFRSVQLTRDAEGASTAIGASLVAFSVRFARCVVMNLLWRYE